MAPGRFNTTRLFARSMPRSDIKLLNIPRNPLTPSVVPGAIVPLPSQRPFRISKISERLGGRRPAMN
jgi:hypothetical protein